MADFNTFNDTDSPENTTLSDGSDSTIKAKVSNNNELRTADISDNGGTQAALTVGTSAVEIKVGGSALANRKFVTLYNASNATIYWGYTNAVTTSTGTAIFKDQERGWACGPSTSIWVIAASGSNNTRITERA